MRLTESEGKSLLQRAGIDMPDFCLIKQGEPVPDVFEYPIMIKAQTLKGRRGRAGLIKAAADKEEAERAIKQIWKGQYTKWPFDQLLIEPRHQAVREYYVSFSFRQGLRGPALVLSRFGGMDIKEIAKRRPGAIIKEAINPIKGLVGIDYNQLFKKAGFPREIWSPLSALVEKLYRVFVDNDCELLEVNPLLEVMDEGSRKLIPADCKIVLDDTAFFRHDFPLERRIGIRPLTQMEIKAREIDTRTHRGVVGRTFMELDGDIAVMSSGGGASISCLDALISYGGRPACFAEYSGNPERQDVRDLTSLILSKEGLKALWVVGPTANFTDVYETLSGIMDAVKQAKPNFPIIIRRAGPRDDEAKEMVEQVAKETGLDISFYGEEMPMTESARVVVDKLSILQ